MKLFKEFKEFISRGSVIDLAVGVIIGGAFSAIVTALVGNIFMPIISLFVDGGLDNFYTILPNSKLAEVQDGTVGVLAKNSQYYEALSIINWGALLNAIINFLLIALILFSLIKIFAAIKKASDLTLKKMHGPVEEIEPEPEPEPEPDPQLVLLTEIRDLLQKDKPKEK